MKTNQKILFAVLALGLVISCKNAGKGEYATEAVTADSVAVVASTNQIASSSAAKTNNYNKKFIRKADIKFRVDNVAKKTIDIEEVVTKNGGYVTFTDLRSHVNQVEQTQVSPDSILETKQFTVDNTITIKVPDYNLDATLKNIITDYNFLEFRKIEAEDVTLQLVANQLAQKRSAQNQQRLSKAIDEKGKKLDQIVTAEKTLDDKKEASDFTQLSQLQLNDDINFSTITLAIYQPESYQQTLMARAKSTNAYRPNIGLQIIDSFKSGWFILEEIIAFVVVLWPFALIAFLSYLGYKKWLIKTPKPIS